MSSKAICPKETAVTGPPLFQNGRIVLQVYQIGWIISGFFAIIATVVSVWLVNKHLQWYTIVNLKGSSDDYSTVLILVRDAYESTALTAFLYLLLMYISHDPEEQKALFLTVGLSREADLEARKKGEKPRRWIFPLGFLRWKPQDGLHFLQVTKWGVLQYCVIRPTTTLVAVILNYLGLYCEDSWGLGWGHIYISFIVSISVTIAMYFLIQLYITISAHVAPRRPLLQLFAIKVVVFLTFWQSIFISLLTMLGVIRDSKYMTTDDVNVGIEAVLETFEMALIALLHIRAYSYKPYVPFSHPGSLEMEPERTPRLRSLAHAMNFTETLRELWIGCIYMRDKFHGREPAHDVGARRTAHYVAAFGRSRPSQPLHGTPMNQEATLPKVGIEVEVEESVDIDIEGEKQWLGLGDDYVYGLRYAGRERSDSLGTQIDRELERRGLISDPSPFRLPVEDFNLAHTRKQPSWWRRLYGRFSEHGSNEQKQMSVRWRPEHSQIVKPIDVSDDNPAFQSKWTVHRGSHQRREIRNGDSFSAGYGGFNPQVSSQSSLRDVRETHTVSKAIGQQAFRRPWPDSAYQTRDIDEPGPSSVKMTAQTQDPEQSQSRHYRESAFHTAHDIPTTVVSPPLSTRAPLPRGRERRSDLQNLCMSGIGLQTIPDGPHGFEMSDIMPSGSLNGLRSSRSDNTTSAPRRPRPAETYAFTPGTLRSSGFPHT
ncbi:hypothetical protein H0H92_007912 [Tricholoma furcatifolium]|nr:hypothetical protein H0H92_007912 [Tricholoma furcatifolium]